MAPQPHELLDQAMEDRRLELGMTWKQVSAESGVTVETLSALRKGRTNPHNASQLTRRGIERALKWATGGYDDALAGRKPTALANEAAHPDHAPPAPVTDIDPWSLSEDEFRALPAEQQMGVLARMMKVAQESREQQRGGGQGQRRTG